MRDIETLQAARDLLSVPERWTRGIWARNFNGESVPQGSNEAVCWCMDGAIGKVLGVFSGGGPIRFFEMLCPDSDVPGFNDRISHAEMLSAFDKAIAKLEATK